MRDSLGWLGIIRLGVVQMALGGVVALATSTLNRVMVVELALPATLPGLLFGIHYAAEMLRPRWGYGSDRSNSRTAWVIGGMAILGLSGLAASASVALMAQNTAAGIACAILAYIGIGIGAGAAGTSLLVILAKLTTPVRKPAAAALVWILMIAGTAISARGAGSLLDPFSMTRLVAVSGGVSAIGFVIAVLSIWGVERGGSANAGTSLPSDKSKLSFRDAMREVWAEPQARRLTIFIFISMLAFSAQELLLEPFAGAVFDMTPGETAKLFGAHRAGIVLGMVLGALMGSFGSSSKVFGRGWISGGCFASALGLVALAIVGIEGLAYLLKGIVFTLGIANGAYAVAAIGTMISLAGAGKSSREGVRMGLWGAAQAIAFGLGGVAGTATIDITRHFLGSVSGAYSLLFLFQSALFIIASILAARLSRPEALSEQDRELQSSFNPSARQFAGQAGAH
jgi:MFS transporter, BCD family, chlorophyll transporter